ncbi:MAG: peptidylprolyl isomerase [Kordiimonadaceae bacterium]|nr:peptidylprolyl isomerase [Kordiimonadaceae bacterium]MBO6569401.1 peptidylprolyl isomerase [Kordiimonadaceae bacterium]MBO6964876.1 peptidylprolyl isomerase [Kordiimonadaceae bacterium]
MLKIKTVLHGLIVTGLFFAVSTSVSAQSLQSEFLQAVDERRNEPELLARSVENWDNRALRIWGLMGAEACEAIRPFLDASEDVQSAALEGLANCRDTASFPEIADLAKNGGSFGVRAIALEALGFTAAEENRAAHVALVADVLASDKSDDEKAAALYGLMQSITYSGLTPADLPGLDFEQILSFAGKPGKLGFEAAYFLTRIGNLDTTLELEQLTTLDSEDADQAQTYHLTRLLSQFGEKSFTWLGLAATQHSLNSLEAQRYAVAAIRGMGSLSDPQSRTFLMTLLLDAAPEFKQLALAALAAREDADAVVQERIWNFVEDENPWLAVTALEGLVRLGDERAREVAATWLADGSFYKAFRAIALLAGSDEGRAMLQSYLDTSRDPVRARLVQGTLDPDAVRPAPVRPTVPYVEAAASDGTLITLQTTRGDITIEMFEGTPYSGHAFVSLVREGAMDGMIWHRVIPGFVAQFGQIDDMRQFSHGTIREEWGALSHMPGTVGVATAGPDTGSSQFFINLEHNRHLDGRYTVFGRVVSGMDVVYAMQEGDEILKAE